VGVELPTAKKPKKSEKKGKGEKVIDFKALVVKQSERAKPEPYLSNEEKYYFKALLKKHKTNYKKMFQDLKLNYNQLTEHVCEKKCKIYLEKFATEEEKKLYSKE